VSAVPVAARRGPVPSWQGALALPHDVTAPRSARCWLARALTAAGARPALQDVALLLVSEAVTNAVRHARPPVVLSATCCNGTLRVAVRDGSAAAPVPTDPYPDHSGGRGLMVIERLSHDWGSIADGAGKTVWFELRGAGEAPY
jgi:anti-sigma regulatory factor (Ser/Thr protein kinase)